MRLSSKTARLLIRSVLVLVVLLAAGTSLGACSKPPAGYSGPVDSIRFGDLNVESSAFVYIAEEQKLFTQNGLNVAITAFDTGPHAIEALLNDQVDLITTGEFAFIVRILAKNNLSVIGSMDKYQAFYLIGRQDRGIKTPADLRGKTIGVVRQALPEFYLGRFLDLHGMSLQSVNVVDVKPSQWLEAISGGEVDAIVVSQVYVNQVQALIAGGVTTWPVQSNQDAFGLVYGRTEWVTGHADLVRRFLMSLAQAEAYSLDHPVETQAIVQKRLNLGNVYLASAWPQHRLSLSLDQSLVAAMEDETRWMIENNLTTEKQVPNFLDYIYMGGLEAVIPDAVNIIH